MTFSDANPVQFWLEDCDTFNEKEVDGVFSKCFCQPFNQSDEITVQFKDDPGQSFNLLIEDSEGTPLYEEAFTEVQSGFYQHTFTPQDEGLSDQIQLKVKIPGAPITYLNETGFSDDGLTTPWLIAPYQLTGKRMTSSNLSPSIPNGTAIDIDVTISAGTLQDFTLRLLNSGGTVLSTHVFGDISTGTHTVSTTTTGIVAKIDFIAGCNNSVQTGEVSLISITDSSSSTIINVTDFSTGGWSNIDNGGTANWNFNVGEMLVTLNGSFPTDVSDYGRSPAFAAVASGASVNGTITHNVPIGMNGASIQVYMWNGSARELIWDSGTFSGSGADVTANIPSHVMVQNSNTNIEIVAQHSTGSGSVHIKDVFLETAGATYTIPDGDFSGTFADWTQSGSPGYTWTQSGGDGILTVPAPAFGLDYTYAGGVGASGRAIRSGLSIAAGNYQLLLDYNQEAGTTTRFLLEFRNSTTLVHSVTTDETGPGTYTDTITIPSSVDNVRITATSLAGSGQMTVTDLALTQVSASLTVAKSDCLDIKESHEETVLINYHNNRVFASINSAAGTPDPEFNLRIPAIFFEERFPKESESLILSNSRSVQLNAQVRRQKMLKVKPMPYYMHLKTQLALVFQTVTIDGIEWTLEESYEIDTGNPRYPLKKATAWLTDKNYVLRNVL